MANESATVKPRDDVRTIDVEVHTIGTQSCGTDVATKLKSRRGAKVRDLNPRKSPEGGTLAGLAVRADIIVPAQVYLAVTARV